MVTRFWIRFGEALPIDQEGYLHSQEVWPWIRARLCTLTELMTEPCVFLLGEPGMGKTRALELHVDELRKKVLGTGDCVELIQLKSDDLEPALRKIHWFHEDNHSPGVLHLFIDSLDEYMWHVSRAATQLGRLLAEYPALIRARLRLRIACRTQQLPQVLIDSLSLLWPDILTCYELVPLRREDVDTDAQQLPRPEEFLSDLKIKRLGALASRPITLNFLIALARRGPLPTNRSEIYAQGCRMLCTEPDQGRLHISRHPSDLDPDNRMQLAERIAAAMFLCQKHSIWMGGEPAPTSDEVTLRQLVQAVKELTDPSVGVTEYELRSLIEDSALFTSIGTNRAAFSHQTYPEFLTAKWLARQPFHDNQLLSLLSPAEAPDQVAPPFYEVAAWLASLREGVLKQLARQQPKLLLRSDLTAANPEWRRQICAYLLAQYAERRLHLIDWNVENYRELGHPGLAMQLEPFITGRQYHRLARHVALLIAHGCRTVELTPVLLARALDMTEEDNLRETAVRALLDLADRATLVRLHPLIDLPAEQDPRDEIRGLALAILWRHQALRPSEVLVALVGPRQPNFHGSYQSFVGDLVKDWPIDALLEALAWVAAQPERECLTLSFRRLLEAYLRMGLQQIDAPGVRSALAQAVTARLSHYEDPFADEYISSADDLFKPFDSGRRGLIAALVEIPETPESIFRHIGLGIGRRSWLRNEDLDWLLERLESEPPEQRVRWSRLVGDLVHLTGSLDDRVYEAACLHPEMQEALPGDFKPVALGSEQAREMQEHHRLHQEHMQRRQKRASAGGSKPPPPPLPERIAQAFSDSVGAGELPWPGVAYELSFKEDGRIEQDIDDVGVLVSDGWTACDTATQQRILGAAESYLTTASPPQVPIEYGPNGMTTTSVEAVVAFRAFQLLMEAAPVRLRYLTPELFDRWMTMLINYPCASGWKLLPQLLGLAYQQSPTSFLEALIARLDRENSSGEVSLRMNLLRQFLDSSLAQRLADWITSGMVQHGLLQSILEVLLPSQPVVVLPLIKSFIPRVVLTSGPHREMAVAAGSVLLRSSIAVAWETIAPVLEFDAQYGLDILWYGGWYREEIWQDALPDRALADLYILLRRHYPDFEDDGTPKRPDPDMVRYPNRMHTVQPEESMAKLRDALLSALIKRPRRAAIDALDHAIAVFPLSERLARAHECLTETQRTAALAVETQQSPLERLAERISRLRTAIRDELYKALPTDTDLESFCLDYFPLVQKQFTIGMELKQKQNLLLAAVEPDSLLSLLRSLIPPCE